MKKQSRRQFNKSCMCLAAAGVGSPVLSLISGCERKTQSAVQPDMLKKERETLPLRKREKSARGKTDFEPAYLKLHKSGELKKRGQ